MIPVYRSATTDRGNHRDFVIWEKNVSIQDELVVHGED